MRTLVFIKRVFVWLCTELALVLLKFCKYVHIAELVSLIPLSLGNQIRYKFYAKTLQKCGKRVTINFGTIISSRLTEIGDDIWLGTYNIIGEAQIKDYTLTAPGCLIMSGAKSHSFSDVYTPIMQQSYKPIPCKIGPDVWIGAGAVIMANVGRGCVIGAGSIVNKDIPDLSVAAGNPARVVRSRI